MIPIWVFIVAGYLLIGAVLGIWVESASSTSFSKESVVAFLTFVFLWPHLLVMAILEITVGLD